MAESGYDTLNIFKTDIPIEPLQGLKPLSGGTFSIGEAEQKLENDVKDEINLDLATTAVDQTPDFNQMALDYVNSYIPVRQASEENASYIAAQLGLGKRVSPEEVEAQLKNYIGEYPKTKGFDKGLNFFVDALNARTPYKGAAGIFDVLAQATGKTLTREEAEQQALIAHNLKISEMAVQQAQDANAAMLEKESEFFLKKMGMDDDYLQNYLGFTKDLQLKSAQFDIDKEMEKIKTSQDLIKNPGRLFQNITYTVGDQSTVSTSMRKYNPATGEYQYFLPRLGEDGGTVFDVPIPGDPDMNGLPNFYFSPLETPQTDAALATSKPNFGQQSELVGDFSTLGRAGDIVETMLKVDEDAMAEKGTSRYGIEGGINYLKQEGAYTFASLLNAINPGSGSKLVAEGETLYNKDQTLDRIDDSLTTEIVFEVPKTDLLSKLPGVPDTTEIKRQVGIKDLYRPFTYTSMGYDEEYARNKVRENLIIYALARALKPTGRLNVDDIKRASDLVNLQGVRSPQYVRAQLKEILKFIRTAQLDIYKQGRIDDKNNVFNAPEYSSQINNIQQFLGEVPNYSSEEIPNINPEKDISPVDDPIQKNEYILEPEDLFNQGGNI